MFNAEMIAFFRGYFIILFFIAMIFFFNGDNKNQEDYFSAVVQWVLGHGDVRVCSPTCRHGF